MERPLRWVALLGIAWGLIVVHPADALDVRRLTLQEVDAAASVVVIAETVSTSYRNAADDSFVVRPLVTLRGSPQDGSIRIETPYRKFDPQRYPTKGDRVLLFLREADGRFYPVGVFQGILPLGRTP